MCLTSKTPPPAPPPPAPVAVPKLKDPTANPEQATAQAAGTKRKTGLMSLRIDRSTDSSGLNVPKD